jgi:uncharacterized phage protein (TIGR02218 family)
VAVTPFDTTETSNADGAPIRLYEFRRGSQYWRYNTSDRDVLRNGHAWLGGLGNAISDEGIRQSGEASQDDLKVTLPSYTGIAQLFQVYTPSEQAWITVLDTHANLSEAVVSWIGSVTDVKRQVPGTTIIVCQNLTVTLSRAGLRLSWSRSCPYSLYEPRTCRVNPLAYQTGLIISAVSGTSLTVSGVGALPDGWFNGGYLEWVDAVDPAGVADVMERRGIEAHTGSNLKLLGHGAGIAPGLAVVAYPGCARNAQVCNSKFQNILNYGGVPGLPGKSPFDGNPVF